MDDDFDLLERRAREIQRVADDISTRFDRLSAFEEAAYWKADVEALLELLIRYRGEVRAYRDDQQRKLERAENEYYGRSFLRRTLSSRSEEKKFKEQIELANDAMASVDKAMSDLNSLVDLVPITSAEQKRMLQEYKQAKKELTTEKRAVTESMRQIRASARQTTASLSPVRGKTGTYARTYTRLSKEGQLAPHEEAKAMLEAQLIDIDRQINRLSLFTGTDTLELPPTYRCAYCGRRAPSADICPGCGSNKINLER